MGSLIIIDHLWGLTARRTWAPYVRTPPISRHRITIKRHARQQNYQHGNNARSYGHGSYRQLSYSSRDPENYERADRKCSSKEAHKPCMLAETLSLAQGQRSEKRRPSRTEKLSETCDCC